MNLNTTVLGVASVIVGVFGVMIILIMVLSARTQIFWQKCQVCSKKREWFYYVGETNARYIKQLDGCQIGDVVLDGGQQVCTQCCREHKLFDNY
jgi:hypothetical protein